MKGYPGEAQLAKAFQAGVEYRKVNPRAVPAPPVRPDPTAPLVGREVALGERSFSVATLSLGEIRRLVDQGHVSSVQGLTPRTITAISETVLPGARKNYPGLTREQLEEMLDLTNYQDALRAAAGLGTLAEQTMTAIESALKAAFGTGALADLDGLTIRIRNQPVTNQEME